MFGGKLTSLRGRCEMSCIEFTLPQISCIGNSKSIANDRNASENAVLDSELSKVFFRVVIESVLFAYC